MPDPGPAASPPLLLNRDGTYNRGAIMAKALRLTAHHSRLSPQLPRARLLSRWLKDVWAEAHQAAARYDSRHRGGGGAFGIVFDAIRASFAPDARSPAGGIAATRTKRTRIPA